VLDERVRGVLARLEGTASPGTISPETGRFLFALVAPQTDCEVLEVGAGEGYGSLWLAAGVRYFGGRLLSLERDPAAAEAWRRNVADAGLEAWAELIEGDPLENLAAVDDVFDVVFLRASGDEHERYFELARTKVEAGGLVLADGAPVRREDPALVSVTVPIGSGVEMTVVLSGSL
jgi:predicted O-methyltransferase YrrM